jgi:hypothetical protein
MIIICLIKHNPKLNIIAIQKSLITLILMGICNYNEIIFLNYI